MKDGKISMGLATGAGLAAIIGAGIFVLSGTAIALAGANALLAFVIVGIVAIIIALEIGELGSILPNTKGASYSYTYKAFGSELGFITGIVQYFSYASGIAVIALGFGSYLSSLFGITAIIYSTIFAIVLIIVLAIVNLIGIKSAVESDFVLVIIKVVVLLAFIGFALLYAFGNNFSVANFQTTAAQGGISSLFAASIVIFFAYSGFQTVSTFTSKVRGGSKKAAMAILYSVIISIALYVLVVLALILLQPTSQYAITADPLATALIATNAPQWMLIIVGIGALIATASATIARILASSRVLYQMAEDKLLPKPLARFNKKRDVATNAVILSSIIGIVMLFSGNIYQIAAISNFGLLFAYMMASLALIHYRKRGIVGEFKMPGYPYLPVIAIVALLLFMIGMPTVSLIIGVIMVFALIIIYYTLREVESKKIVRVKLFR